MAVDASHLTLHPPQLLLTNPIMTLHHNDNGLDRIEYRTPHPPSAADTLLLPEYYSSAFTDPDPTTSRKRSRDSDSSHAFHFYRNNAFTFIGEDISSQIQRQQFEIDQYVARHAENVRVDVEQKRRRNTNRLIAALDESIIQTLRAKEVEIAKMTKLNWALEQRVRSLCAENQIWRELAETNASTANALRSNLKQILEQEQLVHGDAGDQDDAQSCCESSSDNERTLAEQDSSNGVNRKCKSCWRGEACVLLLPCRHLCLCTGCASSVHICPICKSSRNISVHVHMS